MTVFIFIGGAILWNAESRWGHKSDRYEVASRVVVVSRVGGWYLRARIRGRHSSRFQINRKRRSTCCERLHLKLARVDCDPGGLVSMSGVDVVLTVDCGKGRSMRMCGVVVALVVGLDVLQRGRCFVTTASNDGSDGYDEGHEHCRREYNGQPKTTARV